jgi:hypothetical protein
LQQGCGRGYLGSKRSQPQEHLRSLSQTISLQFPQLQSAAVEVAVTVQVAAAVAEEVTFVLLNHFRLLQANQ